MRRRIATTRYSISDTRNGGNTRSFRRIAIRTSHILSVLPKGVNLVLQNESDHWKGLGIKARCKTWSCPARAPFNKEIAKRNVLHRLSALCEVYIWRGSEERFRAIQVQIDRAKGEYARIIDGSGEWIVLSDKPFRDGSPIELMKARELVTTVIDEMPVDDAKGKIRTSHGWKVADEKTGQWKRRFRASDLKRVIECLRRRGAKTKDLPLKFLDSLLRKTLISFPDTMSETEIDDAFLWASLAEEFGDAVGAPATLSIEIDDDLVMVLDFKLLSA